MPESIHPLNPFQFRARPPGRYNFSFVEVSENCKHIVRFLRSRISERLCQEAVLTVKRVVNPPCDDGMLAVLRHSRHLLECIKRGIRTVFQLPMPMLPSHRRPAICPIEEFVSRLVRAAKVSSPVLVHAVVILERLGDKLRSMDTGRDTSTQHMVFLCAVMRSAEHVNGHTAGPHQWAAWAGHIFDGENIGVMQAHFRALIGKDLKVTEDQVVDRFFWLIYPRSDCWSRMHPERLSRVENWVRQTQTFPPLIALPPRIPQPTGPVVAPSPAPAVAAAAPVAVTASTVLQPVLASKKRSIGTTNASSGMGLTSSQSPSSDISSPIMPRTRSRSCDAILEGANSAAMQAAYSFANIRQVVGVGCTLSRRGASHGTKGGDKKAAQAMSTPDDVQIKT